MQWKDAWDNFVIPGQYDWVLDWDYGFNEFPHEPVEIVFEVNHAI